MPYINIRLGYGLDDEQRAALYQGTTALMNTVMGKRREVTVVHIQESGPHTWSTNGVALGRDAPIGAYVDIKITRGTNTPAEKAAMIAATVRMLEDVVGVLQEACYVVIDDIPADSWGYKGETQAQRAAPRGA